MSDLKIRTELIDVRKSIAELDSKCKELAELVLVLFNKLYEITENKEG